MDKTMKIIIAVIVIFLALAFWIEYEDLKEWEIYSKENNCRESGYVSGSTHVSVMPIVGGNGGVGVGTTVSPKKIRYICDNNIEIYR